MNLIYRSHARINDLAPGECTIHRAADGPHRWWLLWFYVALDTQPNVFEDFAVPIEPNGFAEVNGAGGRTWGFKKTAEGVWQVSPSINVLDNRRAVGVGSGEVTGLSIWHHTPSVIGVPDGESWQVSPIPPIV